MPKTILSLFSFKELELRIVFGSFLVDLSQYEKLYEIKRPLTRYICHFSGSLVVTRQESLTLVYIAVVLELLYYILRNL